MSEAIYAEIILLAGSLSLGLILMAAYDGLRIFRFLIPHSALWTGLEDLLYWLCSSLGTFLLLFYQNDGILRWYAVSGVLAGMLVYNATVSRILLRVLKKAEKYLTMKRRKRLEKAVQRETEKSRRKEQRQQKKDQKREQKQTEKTQKREQKQMEKPQRRERKQKNGESPDGRKEKGAGERPGKEKEKRKSE